MAVPWGSGAAAPLGRLRRRVLGQDSCPLPPSAVPNSHGGPAATVTTHFPRWWGHASLLGSSSGILCRSGWNWGKGQNKLRALGSPCAPQKDASPCSVQVPTGYGKGVPSCQHILSLPWQWLSQNTGWERGRTVPPHQPGEWCPPWGFKSFQPLSRVTGRGVGVW